MSQFDATFTGAVVADPVHGTTPNGAAFVQFPVYVKHSKKPKGSDQYVQTGDVSKVRVTLWGALTSFDVVQGDLVTVTSSLVEKEFETRTGGKGRQLQTDWVENIETRYRKAGLNAPSPSTGWDEPVAAPVYEPAPEFDPTDDSDVPF